LSSTPLAWLLAARGALAAPPGLDVWVQVRGSDDAAHARRLGLAFVEEQEGDWRRFHADAGALAPLRQSGLPWRPAAPPDRTASGYPSPDEIEAALDALAAAEPARVRRVDAGRSVEGRTLAGLWIGAPTPRAVLRVVGTHHGDEQSSAVVALALAQALVAGIEADPDTAALLERDAVLLLPVLNPDGMVADSRYNARAVDLNRNYDYAWSAEEYRAGDRAFSEPETRALRTLASWSPTALGLSLHAGAVNLGWVWNHDPTPTADAPLFEAMAAAYAATCTTPGFWVTNGAEWYVSQGDSNDWSYGRHGSIEFTLELSLDKTPPSDTLDAVVAEHLAAIQGFLAWDAVVAGQVVDAESGRGIAATVQLAGGGAPTGTGPDGRFARPVDQAGAWTATVWAPGYLAVDAELSTAGPGAPVALERAALSDRLPSPQLLSRGGEGRFTLEGEAEAVELLRPGQEPVAARAEGGAFVVDLDGLEAGPWSGRSSSTASASPSRRAPGPCPSTAQSARAPSGSASSTTRCGSPRWRARRTRWRCAARASGRAAGPG
jgi:hypothetical protein